MKEITCNRPEQYSTINSNKVIYPINNTIYWHIESFTEQLPKHKTVLALELAFKDWQEHFYPIKFQPTENILEAQIVIRFRKNGDKDLPTPFTTGVLAYAYAPSNHKYSSDLFMNADLKWTDMNKPQHYSLKVVFQHELGHCFNIGHTDAKQDIMYPTYNPNNIITNDSISAVRKLYSKWLSTPKQTLQKILSPRSIKRLDKQTLINIAKQLGLEYQFNRNKLIKEILNELYNIKQ